MREFCERHKTNFIVTIIATIIVHFTKLANFLPNWDNMFSIVMKNTSMSVYGRWFAGITQNLLSSSYDLQWISGLVASVFLAGTMCLLLDMFKVKSKKLSIVAILVMVTFPSITGAFMYIEWTATYMLSLFMAVLAIYLTLKFKSKWRFLICPILVCLSLGIYQMYFLFAIACAIVYLATELLHKENHLKDYWDFIKLTLYSIAVGFILYYVINKIVLLCLNQSMSDYQGLGNIGILSLSDYWNAIVKTVKESFYFFILPGKVTFYTIFNVLILASLLALLIYILIKLEQKIWIKLLIVVLILAIFPITFAYYFLSKDVYYHTIMTINLFFVYLMFIVLLDRKFVNLHRALYVAAAVVVLGLSSYNFVNANVAYKQLEMAYERTYFEACEVVQFIDIANNEGVNEIIFIGSFLNDNVDNLVSAKPAIVGSSTANFLHTEDHFINFSKYYLGRTFKSFAGDRTEILNSAECQTMGTYPSNNCVKVINGVIVVKLS